MTAEAIVAVVREENPVGNVTPLILPTLPVTFPPTLPITLATADAATAVPILPFIVVVKSPLVGALVKLVTVVIVPPVILVGLATVEGNVTPAIPPTLPVTLVTEPMLLPTIAIPPLPPGTAPLVYRLLPILPAV
jgi:hypothetical protein